MDNHRVKRYLSNINPHHIGELQRPDINLSVILPAYNEENCIDNILLHLNEQTYKRFEVIVVNNGSTDSTADKVNKIKNKLGYPLYILDESKPGPGNARKRGMDEAVYRFYNKDESFNKSNYMIVTTDVDATPQGNWLEMISKGFTSNSIGGLAGTHIASPKINKTIEEKLQLVNYFDQAHQLIIYLSKNNIGRIKMSGPNSAFSAYVYCYVGGIEQPYLGFKVDVKEIKKMQDKITGAGFEIKPLYVPVICSQRRHLYELLNCCTHGQYITEDKNERFLIIRDNEYDLLEQALRVVPMQEWKDYSNKIIKSVLKNVLYNPYENRLLSLNELSAYKASALLNTEKQYTLDEFINEFGLNILDKANIRYY